MTDSIRRTCHGCVLYVCDSLHAFAVYRVIRQWATDALVAAVSDDV